MQTKESVNDFLTDFLVGISDGLLIPFGLIVGMSSHFSRPVIIIVTLCVTIISAISMALSRYFSSRSALNEEHLNGIVSSLDLDPGTRTLITNETLKTNSEWKLIISEINKMSTAQRSACCIGVGYLLAGTVTLLPLLLTNSLSGGLTWMFGTTLLCLFLFGYLKGMVTGRAAVLMALRSVFLGLVVAAVAFLIGRVFR